MSLVIIVQPTSPPVNEHLVKLIALADAAGQQVGEHETRTVGPAPTNNHLRPDARGLARMAFWTCP